MRFVLASCPASTPPEQAFLLMTLPGEPSEQDMGAHGSIREFTPVPCWSSACSGPHPLVEVDAATALRTLTRAAESAGEPVPDSPPDRAREARSVDLGRLYGDPGAVGPAITSAAGAL